MTLGQRIREVVGPCTTDFGRGETWMYVGKNRGTASRNKALIAKLQRVFETYKMVRNCKYGPSAHCSESCGVSCSIHRLA